MRTNSCPKCGSGMAEGFILQEQHGMRAVSNWTEGAPRRSFWAGGLKLTGKRLEVQTFRCRRCGFLENYAMERTSS